MRDSIIVTLAVGPCYAKLAAATLRALAAAGNTTLAVTDTPRAFDSSGAEIVAYQPEVAHVWHAKRQALRAGLERVRTVYCLDADHRLRENCRAPTLPRLALDGAATCSSMFPLGVMNFHWTTGVVGNAKALLDEAAKFMRVSDWRALPWWGDCLYAVTRDETPAWEQFLFAWDRFAAFTVGKEPSHPLILGDGVAMAFAAHACGWAPRHEAALTPLARSFEHLAVGDWRG